METTADHMVASLSRPIFDRLIEILIEKVEMGKVKHPWKTLTFSEWGFMVSSILLWTTQGENF